MTPQSTAPDPEKSAFVTDKARHSSPHGRPGNTNGARICAPVPARRRPRTGFHRKGLEGTTPAYDLIAQFELAAEEAVSS